MGGEFCGMSGFVDACGVDGGGKGGEGEVASGTDGDGGVGE